MPPAALAYLFHLPAISQQTIITSSSVTVQCHLPFPIVCNCNSTWLTRLTTPAASGWTKQTNCHILSPPPPSAVLPFRFTQFRFNTHPSRFFHSSLIERWSRTRSGANKGFGLWFNIVIKSASAAKATATTYISLVNGNTGHMIIIIIKRSRQILLVTGAC